MVNEGGPRSMLCSDRLDDHGPDGVVLVHVCCHPRHHPGAHECRCGVAWPSIPEAS